MGWNDYWLSLMAFAAIVCFGLVFAVHRASLMHCCGFGEARHDGGTDRGARSEALTAASAFDAYRADTLRRLEDEEAQLHGFLDRLRSAKDQAEFDAFMAQRRSAAHAPLHV
jgi:uncharacterized protein DUF2852